ncbi:MAG: hypothetical protein B6244_12665 [Candidatus Cloacimonetes bacterium 4572_55]|nr:MAG: hypothetical protein B6244_12665 [Candidatus Cloacimonetes bacterium 4572_55]
MTEKEARKRVKELKEFYNHLGSYLIVNLFLMALSLMTKSFWFIFPLLGWGIGILSHAAKTFGLFGYGGSKWEERKMQELMGRSGVPAEFQNLRQRIQNLEIISNVDESGDPVVAEDGKESMTREELICRLQQLEASVAEDREEDHIKRDSERASQIRNQQRN